MPELGESSATSLTPRQEQQIGAEVLRRMRQGGYIIDDPLISDYVEELGLALALHSRSEHPFTFFVVDAPSINAFALPGGYIGVHSGLILASRTESELASVIAHEIAHVTQHHLARGVEQANRMQLPITVALIAAIMLSGGDPNVANAAIAASVGGSEQMQLNFTRAHEQEADRVGLQLLASSEYDPRGMADFFSRLQEDSRYYGDGVPEFLRTHPVTTARLAEAQTATARMPRRMRADSSGYQVAKARIRLHHSKGGAELLKTLPPENTASNLVEADTYLRAITHAALKQYPEAERLLQKLVARVPQSIAYRETLGRLYLQRAAYPQALSLYREGLRLYPNNELLALSLAEGLLAQREFAQAREVLQGPLRQTPPNGTALRLLAQLETEDGNLPAAHLAQAEYYLSQGEPHSALEQLTIAKRLGGIDFYHASRIEALNTEIVESLEEQEQLPR